MVVVTINYQGNFITSFEVKGHADYAEEGKDIYCAGVSAITQTTLIGLIKHLTRPPVYNIEKGILTCKIADSLNEEDMKEAQVILSTMEAGLLSLQEAYDEFVKVVIRRC